MKTNVAVLRRAGALCVGYGVLGTLAVCSFLLPSELSPTANWAVSPDDGTIEINGLVRDFTSDHPDFNISPAIGQHAGSVNQWLSGGKRPVFLPGVGYKVEDQWRDQEGRAIPPHLAGVRAGVSRQTLGFRVARALEFKNKTSMDAFNSVYGTYAHLGNYGSKALVSTNSGAPGAVQVDQNAFVLADIATGPGSDPSLVIAGSGIIGGERFALEEAYEMPDLELPDDLESYVPNQSIGGVVTLEGDTTPDDDTDDPALHVGSLTIAANAVVTIAGDLRIRCDKGLTIDRAEIRLLPGANLTFYVSSVGGGSGDVKIKKSLINVDPGDTTLVSINALGTGRLEIEESHVFATVIAPDRELKVKNAGHLYGAFIGDAARVESDGSGLHIDSSNARLGPQNYAISVREKIEIDDSVVDSFDSNEGPYGGTNIGSRAWIATNQYKKSDQVRVKGNSVVRGDLLIGPGGDIGKVVDIDGGSDVTGLIGYLSEPRAIPVVAPPALGASVGDRTYDGGVHVVGGDLRCKKLKLDHGAVLKIVGDRIIRIDDKLEMKDGSRIDLEPGATLIMYVGKDAKIEKSCEINTNTGNPQLVNIRRVSVGKKGKVEITDASTVCAWIQGAKTELKLEDSELFGTFIGRKATVKKSRLHVDMAYLSTCIAMDDTAGVIGPVGDGGVTSDASFSDWFRDVPSVNQSNGHPITLTRDLTGVWEYLDDAFYPIDNTLLGNEGADHNQFFTYSLAAEFTFSECGQQFVEFQGGDGMWLFINRRLAMDLGGVGAPERQIVHLDRLGLEDGESYELRLFFAQRRPSSSVFRLRTNLELSSDTMVPSVTAMFD